MKNECNTETRVTLASLVVVEDFVRVRDPEFDPVRNTELMSRFSRWARDAVVFPFDNPEDWSTIVPHLSDPRFVAALDEGMREWVGPGWDPREGPWSCGRHEFMWEEDTEGDLDDWGAGEDDLEADGDDALSFPPQPGTIAWYRGYGGCHFIAPAFAALGRLVYPELTWRVVRGKFHSVAWGFSDEDRAGVLMDPLMTGILEPATAAEIVEFVLRTHEEERRLRAEMNGGRDVLGPEEGAEGVL